MTHPARALHLLVLLSALMVTAACAARKDVHRNGDIKLRGEKPVRLNGKHPGDRLQKGIASWYGHPYHGRKTSNGETYNMDTMTAAHKTLPFNTIVKVVDPGTGKSVYVRINDRGPFVKGRIIDLSRAAARRLGIDGTGTADVHLYLARDKDLSAQADALRAANRDTRTAGAPPKNPRDAPPRAVSARQHRAEAARENTPPDGTPQDPTPRHAEPAPREPAVRPQPGGESTPLILAPEEVIEEEILEPEYPDQKPVVVPAAPSAPTTAPPIPGVRWTIQVGSFSTRDRAQAMAEQMRGFSNDVFLIAADGGFRVRVGAFADRADADALAARLKARDIPTWVTRHTP